MKMNNNPLKSCLTDAQETSPNIYLDYMCVECSLPKHVFCLHWRNVSSIWPSTWYQLKSLALSVIEFDPPARYKISFFLLMETQVKPDTFLTFILLSYCECVIRYDVSSLTYLVLLFHSLVTTRRSQAPRKGTIYRLFQGSHSSSAGANRAPQQAFTSHAHF